MRCFAFMPGGRHFPVTLTGILCLMIGLILGAAWMSVTKPRIATEHLVPVKVVGRCSIGYSPARIVEITTTKQRCYVKGLIGDIGDEFTIDPDELRDYRPLLPPKETK